MNKNQSTDVYGKALFDYHKKGYADTLFLHTSYETTEEMPVDWLFRNEKEFPDLEYYALELCEGKTLDIGAGVGSHALFLQNQNLPTTALEFSSYCEVIMQERGVKNIICADYQTYPTSGYDTILMLMNGIGIVGTLTGLVNFLKEAKRLLNPGGQLIFDSSDISYLYENKPLPKTQYYGEIAFQYEYHNKKGKWFDWLYVDQATLAKTARMLGWSVQLIYEDPMGQYVVRLFLDNNKSEENYNIFHVESVF